MEAIYHLGPLCQTDLAQKILKSTGNMTLVVDNLEKRALVRRERDGKDRRYVTIHLTEAGEGLIAELFSSHVAIVVDEIGVLSADEQVELGRLCRKLGRQRREIPRALPEVQIPELVGEVEHA